MASLADNGVTWINASVFNCTLDLAPVTAFSSGTWNPAPFGISATIYSKRSIQQFTMCSLESRSGSATLADNLLTISSGDLSNTYAIGVIGTNSFAIVCSTPCTYIIPTFLLVKDDILHLKIFQSDILINCIDIPIDATLTCEITTCSFLCLNKINQFLCYSLREQIFIGIAFTVACLVLVIALLWIGYKIYCCSMRNYQVVNINTDMDKEPKYPNDSNIEMVRMNSMSFLVMLMCLSILVSPIGAQCTTTSIAVTPINSCVATGTTETCTIQINILSTLRTVGSSTCGRLLDSSGSLIGSFNMTYLSSGMFGFTTPSYYTSSWTPLTISNKHCPGAGKCSASTNCPALPWNCTTLGIAGTACLWPNHPICQASCGCAGCGCFICSSACLFGTYSFLPSGPIYQVLTITNVAVSPTIQFCVTVGSIAQCQIISLTQQPVTLLSNYTANVLGSFITSTTVFNNLKLVVGNGNAYLAPSADPGNPVFGTIGDIQTTSAGSLAIPSHSAYVYPSTAIIPSATQSALVYSFPSPGLGSLSNFLGNKLPFLYGGTFWSYDGTNLVGIAVNAPAVQVSFSTISPVTFSFLKTVVCPSSTLPAKLAGFYDSDLGFTITLPSVRSTCSAGAVTVAYTDSNTDGAYTCFTNVLNINLTLSSYVIFCVATQPRVSGTITLAGEDSSVVIPFNGVLSSPPALTQQQINDIVGNATVFPETSSFTDWWNSMKGTALSVMKYGVSVILGLVVLAMIIGVLVLLYLGISRYMEWKSLQSFNNYSRVGNSMMEIR